MDYHKLYFSKQELIELIENLNFDRFIIKNQTYMHHKSQSMALDIICFTSAYEQSKKKDDFSRISQPEDSE